MPLDVVFSLEEASQILSIMVDVLQKLFDHRAVEL